MKNYPIIIGIILTLFWIIILIFGTNLPFVDSDLQAERMQILPSGEMERAPFPPSKMYPLGTDRQGRDLLSLIIIGAKETFLMIFVIVLIRYIIAVPLGLLASVKKGFFKWLTNAWSRLFSSIPLLFSTALLLCMPFLLLNEQRLVWSIIVIALIEVGKVSEIIRTNADILSKKLFVEAGKTVGVGPIRMMKNYYFPNLLPDVIIQFFIDAGRVTILISQLAILNIFISQNIVQIGYGQSEILNTSLNWAGFLSNIQNDLFTAPWILLSPLVAMILVTFMCNFLGEGLRRHFQRKA
ncbi:ABC transporter permease subunit [Bacillaceae bacterium Marseille-Q3522]|nr:ABC transporter permease subunit [Bacillaceae bacterium Marseille-Q3522]